MFAEDKPNPLQNTITRCVNGCIEVNKTPYAHSIALTPMGRIEILPMTQWTELNQADLPIWQQILSGDLHAEGQKPEVVLIGTGNRQAFLSPAVLAQFYQVGVGVECMTSDAAARSYNVLISENRHVAALILLPEQTQ